MKPLRLAYTPPYRFCYVLLDQCGAAADGKCGPGGKERWVEVNIQGDCPEIGMYHWPAADAVWPGFHNGATLPTCMKAIKRARPHPSPAGIGRVNEDARLRRAADDLRFPPCQYNNDFIIWVGSKWRLITGQERELLHGSGFDRTALAWNAGGIKKDPQGSKDNRKTLVGDSFSCFSFGYIAAMLCSKWVDIPDYEWMSRRAGMAPGFWCPVELLSPSKGV